MTTTNLQHLACLTQRLRDAILREMQRPMRGADWPGLWLGYRVATGNGDQVHFADAVAQTATCVHFSLLSTARHDLPPRALAWLVEQAEPLVQHIFRLCEAAPKLAASDTSTAAASAAITRFLLPDVVSAMQTFCRREHPDEDESIHFFEKFLRVYDAATRRRQGVFYTPRPVASFVIRSVDQLLRDEFSLADGLADCSTWQEVSKRSGARQTRTERGRCHTVCTNSRPGHGNRGVSGGSGQEDPPAVPGSASIGMRDATWPGINGINTSRNACCRGCTAKN